VELFYVTCAMPYPRPVRAGGVTHHSGGHPAAAARRAGRRGDGFQPLGLRGEDLAGALTTMRTAAREAGRDPGALEVTLGHAVTLIDQRSEERLAAAGADRIVLAGSGARDLDRQKDELSACAERPGLNAGEGWGGP